MEFGQTGLHFRQSSLRVLEHTAKQIVFCRVF